MRHKRTTYRDLVLEDLLADPICRPVMERDGIRPTDVRNQFASIQRWRQAMRNRPSAWTAGARGGPEASVLCRLSPLCEGLLPIAGSVIALAILLGLLPFGT